jgi:hypothetical protein
MRKNIVVCCDGTGNEYGDRLTNVAKLHSVLELDGQAIFYDPGVGTFSIRETITRPGSSVYKALGLGLGVGFRDNVSQAYSFIVRNFDVGDRIYLFGFSRGAYTARVVASLIRGVGILRVGQENLIPYALRYLEVRGGVTNWRRLRGFRRQFSQKGQPGLVFLGLWDTVSSVSWAWDRQVFTATAQNRSVNIVRHAVSIDERRAFFRTNLWRGSRRGQDVKQVWFAGVHSDVGGSYPECQSGLSKIALEWMIVEAREHGLLVNEKRAARILARPESSNPAGQCHHSLNGLWWLLEVMPKRPYVDGRRRFRINLARRRRIAGRPLVHASVVVRQQMLDYHPPNLPSPFSVEPWVMLDGQQKPIAPPSGGARIQARRRWNLTSYKVKRGEYYRFEATGNWTDYQRTHNPGGDPSYNLFMRLFSPLKRMRTANWFSVIGSVERKSSTFFDIGKLILDGEAWQAPESGTLFAFANDVPFMYWNNSGEISLKMTKLDYLTKSLYMVAHDCPRKLYYQQRPDVYQNNKLEDAFLASMVEGGLQVGALAKLKYAGGQEIRALDPNEAVSETDRLLQQRNVTLYEAAFRYENLFVRVDILVKTGNKISIYEVKAKSCDPTQQNPFFNKRLLKKGERRIRAKWLPYLHDVAFQTYVCERAHGEYSYSPHLLLVDKTAPAEIDGLNQKLLVKETSGSWKVKVSEGAELGINLLHPISVQDPIDLILRETGEDGRTFANEIQKLSKAQNLGQKLQSRIGPHCKSCEFRAKPGALLRSGFSECWEESGVEPGDTNEPFVFDVWRLRGTQDLIDQGIYLARDLKESQIDVSTDGRPGLSNGQRQWEQVRQLKEKQTTPFVDLDGLRAEMENWTFPLHFIDFETARVPIPFTAGRCAYELIAFQFSHHIMRGDGTIEHADQFLHDKVGQFPNFRFIRELKNALDGDAGTIFQYSNYENLVLCEVLKQLSESNEPDRESLISFIRHITQSPKSISESWIGQRNMIDLLKIVERFYFHPLTIGSNSIKRVLPAVLAASEELQKKYSKPIYGSASGMSSKNFTNWTWLPTNTDSTVCDPYRQLSSPFEGVDLDELDSTIFGGNELNEGGLAMTAYAKMQFVEMSNVERQALRKALLRYCELDSLAMAMIVEYWQSLLAAASNSPLTRQ